jgi:hypothetical protein
MVALIWNERVSHLLANFSQGREMHEVAAIGAGHPPGVPDVGDLPANEVSENPDGHVGHVRVVGTAGPVVALKYFLEVVGHAVRYQHYRLIARGASLLKPKLFKQFESVRENHREVGDALGVHLGDAVLQLAYVRQVRLDEVVAEAGHHLRSLSLSRFSKSLIALDLERMSGGNQTSRAKSEGFNFLRHQNFRNVLLGPITA